MYYLLLPFFAILGTMVSAMGQVTPGAIELQKLSGTVRKYQNRLNISQARIVVSVVKTNERLASVRPSKTDKSIYLLELDEHFLETLSPEEQRAAIAHELGHVWIFTHRQYKQSESLANQKALELVSAKSLERLYEKVWQLDGKQGALEDYLALKLSPRNPSNSATALR